MVIIDRISRIDGSTEDGGNAMVGVTCKSSNTPINVTSLLAEVMKQNCNISYHEFNLQKLIVVIFREKIK